MCEVVCKYQRKAVGINLPKNRFWEMTGDEEYAWLYADEVYYVTPGDTCQCVYKKEDSLDFSTRKEITFEVTHVSVDYNSYMMTIKGKME